MIDRHEGRGRLGHGLQHAQPVDGADIEGHHDRTLVEVGGRHEQVLPGQRRQHPRHHERVVAERDRDVDAEPLEPETDGDRRAEGVRVRRDVS